MAGDLAAMKTRIASELSRSNLKDQIALAITDAIAVYQKERFRFSDTIPGAPPTFNTVVDQWIYTSADNAAISTLFNFDYVLVNIGNTIQYLEQWMPKILKLYLQQNTMRGQPTWYAYEGNELMLAPIPSAAYLITLGAFLRVPAPATDVEAGNPWMVDGERLIRARAKFEIATHVTRNPTMMQAMSPDPPERNGGVVGAAWREWKSLKGEANRVTGRGFMRPMQF